METCWKQEGSRLLHQVGLNDVITVSTALHDCGDRLVEPQLDVLHPVELRGPDQGFALTDELVQEAVLSFSPASCGLLRGEDQRTRA